MTADKAISIIISVAILAQAYGLKRITKTWITPGSLFGVFWFVFSIVPLLMIIDAPASPSAMLYILVCSIVFSAGSLLFGWQVSIETNRRHYATSNELYNTKILEYSFYISAGIALVCWFLNMLAQGVSASRIFTDFFNVSHQYILARYNDTLIVGIYSQLSNIFSYTAAAIGGLIISKPMPNYRRLLVIAGAFLPSILVLTVQGAKGMIFLSLSLFYGGWLVRRLKEGSLSLFDRTQLKSIFLGVLLLIPFVTLSFLSRGIFMIESRAQIFDTLLRYYASYIGVHLYAFSDWFSWYIGNPSTQFYQESERTAGFLSFMALFRFLGDDRYVPPGVFDEYFEYGFYLSGNIYTFFRGLITDFGLGGSLGVLFIASVICNSIVSTIMRNRYSFLSTSLFIVMIGYIYTSFIISLFIWNSAFGITLALSLILLFNQTQFQTLLQSRSSARPLSAQGSAS